MNFLLQAHKRLYRGSFGESLLKEGHPRGDNELDRVVDHMDVYVFREHGLAVNVNDIVLIKAYADLVRLDARDILRAFVRAA